MDSTGNHVVIGMTDLRTGIGFLYSDDGGATFTDGGSLPGSYGVPVVKYVSGSTFLFFSNRVAGSPVFRTAIAVHRSTDNGHTWNGPYFVEPTVIANHSAAQPSAAIDPDTGRVALTWIVYPDAGGSEVSVTFSDDVTTPQPTWTARQVLDTQQDEWLQGPTPRFAGNGSTNVYVVWTGLDVGLPNRFIRSTDNGASFGTPIDTATSGGVRAGLGSDSNLMWPSMAVDPSSGHIYIVHATGAADADGGEIRFQKSTDGGLTFSAPVTLNSRPLEDRSQWFPSISFDASTGDLHVVYFDQGFDGTSDLTEMTHLYSNDGGATWSNPRPLTDRPFHAGYGNDDSDANLGFFTGSVAQGGELFTAWGGTSAVGFTDGQPDASMSAPDVFFRRIAPDVLPSIRLGTSTFTDSGAGVLGANGSIDPGETVALTMTLENYVTNSLSAATSTSISGKLVTSTSGVTVTSATATYADIVAGGSSNPAAPVTYTTSAAFVPGTNIEFLYTVTTSVGVITLRFTQATGSPNTTTFYSEDFESITAPALPAGWAAVHGGGSPEVAWTTAASFRGLTTKSAFHTSAVDGAVEGDSRRNERLVSPVIAIPATAESVLLEFDVEYYTYMYPFSANEVDDGMFVRIQDVTPGRTSRTVAVEAFADTFTVDHATLGRSWFYPATLLDSGAANYIPDFSAFGGDAQGKRHVTLKLTGMAASSVQLRFEYSQYSGGNCGASPPCGVAVDNITMKSVVAIRPSTTTLVMTPNPSAFSQSVNIGAAVAGAGAPAADGNVTFKEGATVLSGPTPLTAGSASFNIASLPVGSHIITAEYASTTGDYTDGNDVGTLTVFLPAPAGLAATATSTSNIALSWGAVTGADHYEIVRAAGGAGYAPLTNSGGVAYNDTAVAAGAAYAYRVRTVDAFANASAYSTGDLATTMTYVTDTEVAAGLLIRASHVLEARTAVNRVLAAAGEPAESFTDPSLLSQPLRAAHIDELRAALNHARGLLLVPVLTFTDPTLSTTTLVRASHLRDVINGTK